MDLTVLIVGLLIGVGIPLRNKAVREYRKKGGRKTTGAFRSFPKRSLGICGFTRILLD